MESPAQAQKPSDRRIWSLNPTEREVHEIQQARIEEWRSKKLKTAAYMDELERFSADFNPLDVRHHDFDAKAWWDREYPFSDDYEEFSRRKPIIYQPQARILHVGPPAGTHEDLMDAAGLKEQQPYDWNHGWLGFDAQGFQEHGGPPGTEGSPEYNGWGWNNGWDSPGEEHEALVEQALGVPKAHPWSFKAQTVFNPDEWVTDEPCYMTADALAREHPEWEYQAGHYVHPDWPQEPEAHAWVRHRDTGTLFDPTHSQFEEDRPSVMANPGDSYHSRYHSWQEHPDYSTDWQDELGDDDPLLWLLRGKPGARPGPDRIAKTADTWQPKTIWPNPMSDLDMPIGGDPTMPPCTCEEGNKLECPVHGLHAQVPAYEHELTVRNPNSPAGKDYSGEAPRTWMRAQTKVAADEFDTREYQDSRMMPPMTQAPNATNPHPEKKGCTCEEGRKLDCPVHGMNPTEDKYDHSWSIPESNPVGYPQDQPRNYMTSEGALQEAREQDDAHADRQADEDTSRESTNDRAEGDQEQRKGIDVHDPSIANCQCMNCLKASERGWHMQQPGQEGSGWTGIPRADM